MVILEVMEKKVKRGIEEMLELLDQTAQEETLVILERGVRLDQLAPLGRLQQEVLAPLDPQGPEERQGNLEGLARLE